MTEIIHPEAPFLRDLLTFTRDGVWGKGEPSEELVLMRIIRGTDFEQVHLGETSSLPLRYIPIKEAGRKNLMPGDVLIETAGGSSKKPTGRTMLVKPGLLELSKIPIACASFARFMRVDQSRVEPGFLYWYLQDLYKRGLMAQHQVQHTGVARFQFTKFAQSTRIPLPPLSKQKQITAILSAFDDKIELNRKMNRTLEEMAQALFKSWFVDFDGQEDLVESELGPIPRGWNVVHLGEICEKIGSGATPRGGSKRYVPKGIPLIRSQNIHDSSFIWKGLARLTNEDAERLKGVSVKPNDVLINITGDSILRTCMVDPTVLPARVNQHVAIVRANPTASSYLIHQHLLDPRIKNRLLGHSAGGTRKAITKGHLEKVPCIYPPQEKLEAFTKTISPMYERIFMNWSQSQTLAQLRDTLLPKLISGEIRIPEAEKTAETLL